MNALAAFFAMDGYGAYVYAAFGVTALALAGLLVLTLAERSRVKRRLADWENRGRL